MTWSELIKNVRDVIDWNTVTCEYPYEEFIKERQYMQKREIV